MKRQYAVLTDKDGTICGVVSYSNQSELEDKVLEAASSSIGDGAKSFIGDITMEQTFSIQFNNEPSIEFYLTPTRIY